MSDALHEVLHAAREYGVEVVLETYKSRPHKCVRGPSGSGVRMRAPRALFTDVCSDPEDVLHELAHTVIGPRSCLADHNEAYVLLPFEWALAKTLASNIARSQRARFLRAVDLHQQYTFLCDSITLFDFRKPRSSLWWKQGLARCVSLGVLTPEGAPTWNLATWKRSGVQPSTEAFDVQLREVCGL